jgi:DNA-binding MarR family transcriptional regulator
LESALKVASISGQLVHLESKSAYQEENDLFVGMSLKSMACVLKLGRRVFAAEQSWLETYCDPGDSIAMFRSGRLGLRPISEDVEDSAGILSWAAPAVISFPNASSASDSHWIVEPSEIYFFDQTQIRRAFEQSSQFATNLMHLQQAQTNFSLGFLGRSDPGLRRLGTSLLSRLRCRHSDGQRVLVTQSELAIETGLSRQWVNRLLKQLESKGIAKMGRGHVVLRSPSRLEHEMQ